MNTTLMVIALTTNQFKKERGL